MTKSSLSRSAAVGDAAGDADRRRGIAYYNYQSLPVPSSGIDGLLKFVTSQLSLTILSLFFCCDLSTTPADVIDHVEKMPNCSILNIRMNDDFEMEISKPILQMGSHDPGQLILITDEGNFEALAKRLPGWNLTVFHSSDMDPTFFDYASRAIELPVIAEPEPAVTFEEEMEKPAAANWKPEKIKLNLAGSIMDLADVNKRYGLSFWEKTRFLIVQYAFHSNFTHSAKRMWTNRSLAENESPDLQYFTDSAQFF